MINLKKFSIRSLDFWLLEVGRSEIFNQVCTKTMVFNKFHINQVFEKYHKLFTMEDIVREVEILKFRSSIFSDIDVDQIAEHGNFDDRSLDNALISNWDELRDGSTMLTLVDSQDLECASSLAQSNDESVDSD